MTMNINIKENIDIRPLDENGLKHGLHIYYFVNGNVKYKENYYHGKLNGIYEWYWYNGNLFFKCNYKMGKLYGLDTQYKYYKNDEIDYKKIYL